MERRDFIRKSVLGAAAFTIVPRHVLGGPGFTAPSDQITKAIVGVGGIGYNHHFTREGRLVAVCDVDRLHLERAVKRAGEGVKVRLDLGCLFFRADDDIGLADTPGDQDGCGGDILLASQRLNGFIEVLALKEPGCDDPADRSDIVFHGFALSILSL